MIRLTHHYTNAVEVKLTYYISLYFSYETLVAVRNGSQCVRTDVTHSKTTSKHMNLMGVSEFEKVSQRELEEIASNLVRVAE